MAAEDSIGLTLDRLKQLIHYDPETGVFTRIGARKRIKLGVVQNTPMPWGYTRMRVDKYSYMAHRLAWFYIHGRWPVIVDHINGEPNDNRLCNLREVVHATNMQNRRVASRNNKCGFLGVNFHCGRYRATIRVQGVVFNLGRFDTPEEAHKAYLEAKRNLHSGCTI